MEEDLAQVLGLRQLRKEYRKQTGTKRKWSGRFGMEDSRISQKGYNEEVEVLLVPKEQHERSSGSRPSGLTGNDAH